MNRLLLVGWDAADWKIIDPLLARGEMPHLAQLLTRGVRGNLATIYPPLSPMVWTSIATGKRAYKHGIHGFTEPSEDGLQVRPISNLGRKTKAFWNILNQTGKRSIVVGWWPSHPAEPIRGVMVSNLFPLNTGDDPNLPLAPGTVWPPALAQRMHANRVHAVEITGEILRLFVPEFEKVDQQKDKSLHDLAGIISETMSIHAAATDLMETEPWELAAVYYSGIDHFSHRFMRHHAGKARRAASADPELFTSVVANAYRYHDVMLGRLVALAGPDCAVMVLSDHGFHSDRLLPDYIPAEAAGPTVEHRDFGIFCLRAPGVEPRGRVFGANVMDIAPTVLHLFGLPAGRDMDGKVLINAFTGQALEAPIPSWDQVPGEDGRHAPSRQYDGAASVETLKQLVALGYIAPPEADDRQNVDACVAESRYNLARAYMGGGHAGMAADILEQLITADAEQGRYYHQLFQCRLQQRDPAAAAAVLERFDQACESFSARAREELERRRAERPDDQLSGRPDSPDRSEIFTRRQLAEKAAGFAFERLFLRTQLALATAETQEQKAEAAQLLEQVAAAAGPRPEPALFLAEGYTTLDKPERALEYAHLARRADRDNWQAMALEARIYHAAGRPAAAAESAIESLALVYFQPYIHYLLGVALRHLSEDARAEQSFRVALSQMPGLAPAHDELAALLRRDTSRIGEASLHMARAQVLREESARRGSSPRVFPAAPEAAPLVPAFERWDGRPRDRSRLVTIVSGLPRSGTSMMMQMLAAGGIEPYTDHARAADEDNSRGYFEHHNATRLHEDASWITGARGMAVKIVAHLLPYLPEGEEYRIIFMLRNLEEVVSSQSAMLDHLGRPGAALDARSLLRAYTGQLVRVQSWLQSRPDIAVLAVNYVEALQDAAGAAQRLESFLGEPFNRTLAAAEVDAALRRQRGRADR